MKNRVLLHNLFAFIAVLATIVLGSLYYSRDVDAALFWPAAGLSILFYYLYRKEVLITLIVATLMGNLVNQCLFMERVWYIGISVSFIITLSTVIQFWLFNYLFDLVTKKVVQEKYVVRGLYVILISFIVSLQAALLSNISVFLIESLSWIDMLDNGLAWLVGDFFGIFIFGFPIIVLHNYHKYNYNKHPKVLFYLIFLAILLLIISNFVTFIDFNNSKFFLIVFYLIVTFYYDYKHTIFLSFLIFTFYLLYMKLAEQFFGYVQVIDFNLFLTTVAILSLLFKFFLIEREKAKFDLGDITNRYNDIFQKISVLLSLADKKEENLTNEKLLKDMFQISQAFFGKYDAATCYLVEDETLRFVDVVNEDIDILNMRQLHALPYNLDIDNVYHIQKNPALKYKNLLLTTNHNLPDAIEKIILALKLDEGQFGGLSFSIKSNKWILRDQDIEQFHQFQKLMNSFFSFEEIQSASQKFTTELVKTLIKTLEMYDIYTVGHSEEVAEYARIVGRYLKLEKKDIEDLYWAGLLHDIGKIGVEQSIVNKVGRLDEDEFEKIKKHPIYSYELISKYDLLHKISLIAKYHHEWYDGNGYPERLKGDEIPFGAQILGVCDAISAMSSKRVYHARIKTNEEIIDELEAFKGRQFSPVVADAAIELIREGKLLINHE